MDAAEIARLREIKERWERLMSPEGVWSSEETLGILVQQGELISFMALLDALEQARKDLAHRAEAMRGIIAQRDQAQKDAKDARALAFEECAVWVDESDNNACKALAAGIRAHIEAMLEKKI